MYRANSQPPGCEGPAPPGPGQGLSCLLHDGPGSGRSSDPHPPPAASLLSLSSSAISLRCLTSTPPPLHRPISLGCSWCVCLRGFYFTLHIASCIKAHCWLFLSVLSCIHFSVSLEAVSVSLVYLIHTLHTTSYRPISLVSILSSRAFFDCFVRPVSFFVNPTFRHHRISCLADNILQRRSTRLSGWNTNAALLIANYSNTPGARVWDSPPGNWQHQGPLRPSKPGSRCSHDLSNRQPFTSELVPRAYETPRDPLATNHPSH
jgi:hypothetical protein